MFQHETCEVNKERDYDWRFAWWDIVDKQVVRIMQTYTKSNIFGDFIVHFNEWDIIIHHYSLFLNFLLAVQLGPLSWIQYNHKSVFFFYVFYILFLLYVLLYNKILWYILSYDLWLLSSHRKRKKKSIPNISKTIVLDYNILDTYKTNLPHHVFLNCTKKIPIFRDI